MNQEVRHPIALIGIMGAGKSAVANALGERLGTSVADLDAMAEATQGTTVAELFGRLGEAGFHRLESELLARVLRAGVRVIACGGGIVMEADSRRLLHDRCHVVWLEVSPAEAARRISRHGDPGATRPLLAGGDATKRLEVLLHERAALYQETAHARVQTQGRSAVEVAGLVLASRRTTE